MTWLQTKILNNDYTTQIQGHNSTMWNSCGTQNKLVRLVQLAGMKSLAARPQGYTPVSYVQTHTNRANNCIQQLGLVMDARNHH